MNQRVLLVNPWIYDFSAYDFWLKPIGLLFLANSLLRQGFEVRFLDLVDNSFLPVEIKAHLKKRADGRGKFYAEEVSKPAPLKSIPRKFKRYGVPPKIAEQIIQQIPAPSAIFLGTTMTYWSYGYIETARFLREKFRETPIIAGGLYVTICAEHSRNNLGADFYCGGDYEQSLKRILKELFGFDEELEAPERVRLGLELYPKLEYGVILTGRGCPYHCKYCLSPKLHPELKRKPVEMVIDEIIWQGKELGLQNISFYDDALLLKPEEHIMKILEGVIQEKIKVKFHTPNGLHLKPMSQELANLMKRAGFETIRFGLETLDPARQKELGAKAGIEDLARALTYLENAGYERRQIGVYLLAGLPGQSAVEIEKDIQEVKKLGARAYLSEYSPIPDTALWEKSLKSARYPIEEPLFQNCSLLPCAHSSLTAQKLTELKALCRE